MTAIPPLNRRSLLQLAGGATLALALPSVPVHAGATVARPMLVLVDRRYAESMRFAARLQRQGAEAVSLGRDLARLWSSDLEPRVASGPKAVAGLTLASDLFGLERLAEESGASTVFVRRHVLDHAPRRGSPRHFVSWLMRWGGSYRVGLG